MRAGEGVDELGEGARAGGGGTRWIWQPGRGRLGRESVFRLTNRAAGMNRLSDFLKSLPKKIVFSL